jgi:hypothetical protein
MNRRNVREGAGVFLLSRLLAEISQEILGNDAIESLHVALQKVESLLAKHLGYHLPVLVQILGMPAILGFLSCL